MNNSREKMDEKMEIIYKINIGLEIIVIVGYEIDQPVSRC